MNPSPRSWFAVAPVGLILAIAGCADIPLPIARQGEPAPAPAATLVDVVPEQANDAALIQPASTPFHLGPGDGLEIEVMGDVATRATTTVGPDGKIYYYLLPGLDVWGLTLGEARERLGAELQKYVREKPVVSLSLRSVQSQRVWLLGNVNTPGVYVLGGPTTLLDVVAQAGGPSSATLNSSSGTSATAPTAGASRTGFAGPGAADLTRSFIIRQGRLLRVDFQRLLGDGDLTQNIYLQPDDFVFLPAATTPELHVLGAVVHPQAQPLSGPLTVVQAIALAGGTVSEAYLSNVAVLRGSLVHPQIAIVPVDAVLRGKAQDIRLMAGDIVYVPYTPFRTIERYANLILDTFARTVGINAGAHAAGSNNVAPIGINVSVTP